jgi:hypothetical protein
MGEFHDTRLNQVPFMSGIIIPAIILPDPKASMPGRRDDDI